MDQGAQRPSQTPKFTWLLALVLGLGVFRYAWELNTNPLSSADEPGGLSKSLTAPTPTPLPEHFPTDSNTEKVKAPADFVSLREAYQACWPDRSAAQALREGTPSLRDLESLFGHIKKKETLERIEHLKLSSGKERRLLIGFDSTGDGSAKIVLRAFDVDDEGLPIPIRLAPNERDNPSEATIAKWRESGSPIKVSQEYALVFDDSIWPGGALGHATETNGGFEEIKIRVHGHMLHCASADRCECL